jgi:hypothetical protein
MQRHTYNPVTVPILVQAPKSWSEGEAYVDNDRVRVREFTDDDADTKLGPGKEIWEQISKNERLEILQVVNVIRALSTNDQLAAKKAMLDLKKLSSGPMGLAFSVAASMIDDPDYIPDSLVYQLCRQLENVRLILWKKEPDRKLAPGLFCLSIRSAFWIRALMSGIGTTKGFRICPKCGNVFCQKRSDQEYCSMKCREAHRIERWRAKRKINDSQEVSLKPKAKKRRGAK